MALFLSPPGVPSKNSGFLFGFISFPPRLSPVPEGADKVKGCSALAVTAVCNSIGCNDLGHIDSLVEGTSAALSGVDGLHLTGFHPFNMILSFFFRQLPGFHPNIFHASSKTFSEVLKNLMEVVK